MKIQRAEHLGMCFGVRDAIALAHKQSSETRLTIFGELVHNEVVLSELRERGVQMAQATDAIETSAVMISAHGASIKRTNELKEKGFRVSEATCPLVHFAHRSLTTLVRAGFHPIIIGKPDHVEVRGMTEDLAEFDVVLVESDIGNLQVKSRFGIVSQTTQTIEKVRLFVDLIRKRFPTSEVRFIDTVCQPTKQRQTAAQELARNSDVVLVIGGSNSNNTRELVRTCEQFCRRVYHVQSAKDVQSQWLVDASSLGITAGTSTPDSVIQEVQERVRLLSELITATVR